MHWLARRVRTVVARLLSPLFDQMARDVAQEVTTSVTDDLQTSLRRELVEVHRMLRQQGDASDEVAETLGRTITRLAAEVEALSDALEHSRSTPTVAPTRSEHVDTRA